MIAGLTVCICTRNRPDELERALDSVRSAGPTIAAIVVADDSTDDRTERLVEGLDSIDVSYVPGPRRGLGANRNAALAEVRTSHLLFLDDDARLDTAFVSAWQSANRSLPKSSRSRVIHTGAERNGGALIHPRATTFLGHQSRVYRTGQPLDTIVINATVLPRLLFDAISFDERLIYGSDEVDLAMRAVAKGFRIEFVASMANDHCPSTVNRDYYASHVDAARLYVTWKRYARVERSFVKAGVFAVVAPVHLLLHGARRRGRPGLTAAVKSIHSAAAMARTPGPTG